jgi:predicted RNA binding protein YcfA (HicA-like mRNA interferase family)/predicted RNase H-like HicB family nuclease
MPDLAVTVGCVPLKISEIILLPEQDWRLKRTSGSRRHVTHPVKPGLVTVAGRPGATVKPKTEPGILKQAGRRKGAAVQGYVVVVEGDDESGCPACAPDLPGAAAGTRDETRALMGEAIAAHIALLRDAGEPVPEPAGADSVTILDPAAA